MKIFVLCYVETMTVLLDEVANISFNESRSASSCGTAWMPISFQIRQSSVIMNIFSFIIKSEIIVLEERNAIKK